jgi:hypothetical protein
MISNLQLFTEILRVSLTVAALTLPSVSIAYFIMSRSNDEFNRMSKVITFGSFAGIVLLVCAMLSFVILCCGWEDVPYLILILGLIFLFGCFLIVYILLILSGLKIERDIPRLH